MAKRGFALSSIVLLSSLVLGTGCASSHVPAWPARDAWKTAARDAVRDPATWVPAAGAAVVAAGGWDRDVSRWAVRETPVFGSPHDADRWSDRLRGATHVGMLLGTLLPADSTSRWYERLIVAEAGATVADVTSRGVKRAVGRVRPNGADSESFPSGHATRSAANAAIAIRDLDRARISHRTRVALDSTFYALSGATAWARVEAGVHYPTDVLAGMALGNFVGRVVHDAWLPDRRPVIAVMPERGGVSFAVGMAW